MSPKTFFVVGGSSGIGLELVNLLHNDQHNVYVGSRTRETLDHLPEGRHLYVDVTADSMDLTPLPERLHGVVYCPGTIILKPFQRLSMEDFQKDLSVNLLGAVKILKSCLGRMKKTPEGASIVLFSTVAVTTGMAFHASIASAKGAVEGLTRSLAAELAPRIRVNAIAPSLTDTPLAAPLIANEPMRKAASDRHPLKRIGAVSDVARVAANLLLDTWTTGQVLHVDGGMGSLRVFR